MPSSIEPLSKQLTIIVGLTVVGFMAGGLALSFYQNLLFEQKLHMIEQENGKLAEQIKEDRRRLEYYRSDQYKDKYAKENLGLVNPGERLLLLVPEDPSTPLPPFENTMNEEEQKEVQYMELLKNMPVIEHWRIYLFYPEKLEALRRGSRDSPMSP